MERAQFIVPLKPSTTNCHSLERGNPAYFRFFSYQEGQVKQGLQKILKKI